MPITNYIEREKEWRVKMNLVYIIHHTYIYIYMWDRTILQRTYDQILIVGGLLFPYRSERSKRITQKKKLRVNVRLCVCVCVYM